MNTSAPLPAVPLRDAEEAEVLVELRGVALLRVHRKRVGRTVVRICTFNFAQGRWFWSEVDVRHAPALAEALGRVRP